MAAWFGLILDVAPWQTRTAGRESMKYAG